jgi:predicted adenine nucleotide alpha hydrolase (AANH) superfamily ATPase
MKLLLHICCAPCSVYPVKELRSRGIDVSGYFFNHNIHPYQEYRRRLDAVKVYAELVDLEVLYRDEYLLEVFLTAVAGEPEQRCAYCYASRLESAARSAAENGFQFYSSTLLYSRYQQHEVIREAGERFGREYGVQFFYDDFRRGWQEGIALSKQLELYRQQYCGCVYSEKDRYCTKSVPGKK